MIAIVPYRSSWQEEFMRIGRTLRQTLGSWALRIDHIGSTSIPGLAAKDVIDVQVTVKSLDPQIAQAMQTLGYDRRPHFSDHIPFSASQDLNDWAKWVFRSPSRARAANVHIRIDGKPNQRLPLLFRDFLRSHAIEAETYARIKRELARLHPEDMDAYTAVKDPVCDLIFKAAEDWARATEWLPGKSDV